MLPIVFDLCHIQTMETAATQHAARIAFIRMFAEHSSARHFAARLLNDLHYEEQTEECVAAMGEQIFASESVREMVIGLALDKGLVHATLCEYGSGKIYPCLASGAV
jgi:hypothetical protein